MNLCINFCMLYYLENIEVTKCKICRHSRYKPMTGKGRTLVSRKKLRYFPIASKLQRLFMSPKTTIWLVPCHIMRWIEWWCTLPMVHAYDGETRKHFINVLPQLLVELKSMCLELYTDGFNPFRWFIAPYSYWLMILMVTSCHQGFIWGQSLCFYLQSYQVLIVQVRI